MRPKAVAPSTRIGPASHQISNVGINFSASATPPTGLSNNFSFVQVITNDILLLTPASGGSNLTCFPVTQPPTSNGSGFFLDGTYPYEMVTSTGRVARA